MSFGTNTAKNIVPATLHTKGNCRVCGHKLFDKPLMKLENMPAAAQFLPDSTSLEHDRGTNLEIWQCSACGLVQLNIEPVPYYKKVIRAVAFSDEMKEFRIKQFKRFVREHSLKGKKVLEIGCGCGEYIDIMVQSGMDTYGIEYSEDAVKECIKKGLNVFQGFIEDSNNILPHAPFDMFFMLNFLEHLPNPNLVLKGIYNNLTNNAAGVIEVPNFDMILRNRLFAEFIPDHLCYFTRETLISTLNINGFEVVECNAIWHDYILSAVVKKAPKTGAKNMADIKTIKMLDLSHFEKSRNELKHNIDRYINRFQSKKVAIWGAGHQALAIISLMNLSKKIRYVIDSAPFKQGKYTPATHIPIMSPDTLRTDKVEAIIVMAASYSDEVAQIIRQEFDKDISVSILRDLELEEVP